MRSSTAYNYRYGFTRTVEGILGQAHSFKLPHARILDLFRERLYDKPEWSRVPRHVRAYVQGYKDAKMEAFMVRELVWKVRLHGELVDTDTVQMGQWALVGPGEHVYKSDPTRIF